ncbi:MAG TPA: hypothetical protein VME19_01250 [Streptosporangiaceae bacterium]|nr:hypothetical protein [Streptosporangiaceae bacterium]
MLTGSRSTRRRQVRRRPVARSIVPLAIPMALGLALGVVIAVSGHSPVTRLSVSALGATGTATPGATVTPRADPANTDCELIVPADPLSATGLATPYQLTGPAGQGPAASGCEESDPDLQAFVQATILNPATGKLWVYEPLVVTLGSPAAVAPVVPKLPKNAEVDLMVGFNGGNLQLFGAQPKTLTQAKCVNGFETSLFGQVAYCNSTGFFAAADIDIASGKLRIPGNGTSPVTGQPCPTTRSFDLVDQDPSDNVTTQYLLTASGETAQDNAVSAAALPGAVPISNGSDNRVLDSFLLPALGCTPFTAPDISNGGRPGTSQTLDELSAAANQREPIALVPENDPMTLDGGQLSQFKTDLYRIGVGQPLVIGGTQEPFSQSGDGGQQADTPANFCANMLNIQSAFIAANQARFSATASPVPAMGNNLFTFMAARLSASFTNLGCAGFGLRNTVSLGLNGQGVAVTAAFSLTPQVPDAAVPSGMPAPAPSASPTPPFLPSPAADPWASWDPWGQGGYGDYGYAGYGDTSGYGAGYGGGYGSGSGGYGG